MPLWIATLTMTATWVDGGYLLGTAEGAFASGLPLGLQGGVCFGLSLVLGGLFFAGRMRRLAYTTLIDPFEARFGSHWAAVLFLPALLGEVLWSAELLVAIGATLGSVLGIELGAAILLSASVVTIYTVVGGMWSVAYTDAFQLLLVALGLAVAVPWALDAVGGWTAVTELYQRARPDQISVLPPMQAGGSWTEASITGWWDVTVMLLLGGIPWNCYFQRVLSCPTPATARWHSILAGMLTVALTLPPLLLGVAAFAFPWTPPLQAQLTAEPSHALPFLLQHAVPVPVALLGLAAIIGAVTSSYSASILSGGAMLAWNGGKRLLWPELGVRGTRLLLRASILGLSLAAVGIAWKVRSVQALWFFTSDLVFVLLFPQLLWALFDPRANRIGSIVAFAVSFALRVASGEPLLGWEPVAAYPAGLAALTQSDLALWVDPGSGVLLFPFRVVAAAAGLLLLPLVSRLTGRFDPPRPLRSLREEATRGGTTGPASPAA